MPIGTRQSAGGAGSDEHGTDMQSGQAGENRTADLEADTQAIHTAKHAQNVQHLFTNVVSWQYINYRLMHFFVPTTFHIFSQTDFKSYLYG